MREDEQVLAGRHDAGVAHLAGRRDARDGFGDGGRAAGADAGDLEAAGAATLDAARGGEGVGLAVVDGDVEDADARVLHLREAATTVVGDPQVGAEQVSGARVEEAQVADRAGGLDEGLRVALRGRHVGLREGVHLLPGAAAVLGAQQGRAVCARARRLRERELGLAEAR